MKEPPVGPGGQEITWDDQVAPRSRQTPSTCKNKPQTSNLTHTVHGVLGTALPPSLEQTMGGGLNHTQTWQHVAGTTRGGGVPSSGTYSGQDLHRTPKTDRNGRTSKKKGLKSAKIET